MAQPFYRGIIGQQHNFSRVSKTRALSYKTSLYMYFKKLEAIKESTSLTIKCGLLMEFKKQTFSHVSPPKSIKSVCISSDC